YSKNTVVIYREYNGLAYESDEKVEKALEEKFEKDTGESIDLVMELCSTSSINQKVIGALGTDERIDAVFSHYSTDSTITEMITKENELKDLTELAKTYAPNLLAMYNDQTDPDHLALHKGMYNGKLYGLSSIERNSCFGMLVNKRLMATSSFDPDEYDVSKEGYKSLTLDEFTQMLREIKEAYEKEHSKETMRPIVGAPWEIEYFVSPVFEFEGYTHYGYEDGKCIPAYLQECYADMLEYERLLQEEKLWYENPTDTAIGIRDFYAGKSAVYTSWPEATSQVTIARKLKSSTGDDCVVLAPLKKDAETESNGNQRMASAFFGMIVPNKGENTELLLKFLNWIYSDKENYELAKHGVKGEDWVETPEKDGFETYGYPEDKKDLYEETPPYSGAYCLLSNVYISDRIYSGYTDDEWSRVTEIFSFKSWPEKGYTDEGINLVGSPSTDRTLNKQSSALGKKYTDVRKYAWSIAPLPEGSTLRSMHAELRKMLDGEIDDLTEHWTKEFEREQAFRKDLKL
ncbi:MAG: hypothetical protein ACI4RO_02640, partial [Candidatus Scatosoma sp.]